MTSRLICTMYWDNIDPKIVRMQRQVFTSLGFEIRQDKKTGLQHGEWMDQILTQAKPDDSILFVDIDCIPLNCGAVIKAFDAAEIGRIYGAAQTANHVPDRSLIYAAPSFLSLSAATWESLGRVSLTRSSEFDVGMGLTKAAIRDGFSVKTLQPSFVCCPKWPLGSIGAVGYGTFYESEVFHLFQSRHNKAYEFAFHYVADCVIRGEPVDYLRLFARMNSRSTVWENNLRTLPGKTRHVLSRGRKMLSGMLKGK